MALKFKITKRDEVPAEYASAYVERDGVFVLDVEGAVDRTKLDEFRQNNIALQNRLKEFDGLNVARARELIEKQQVGQLLSGAGGSVSRFRNLKGKRQRTAALQDAGAPDDALGRAKRSGYERPSRRLFARGAAFSVKLYVPRARAAPRHFDVRLRL